MHFWQVNEIILRTRAVILTEHCIFLTAFIDCWTSRLSSLSVSGTPKHSRSQAFPNVCLSSISIFYSLTSLSLQLSLCLNSSSLFLPPCPPFHLSPPSSVCLGMLIIDVHNIFSCTPSILLLKQASFAVSFLFLPPPLNQPPALSFFSSFALSRESHLNSLTITHNPSLQLHCHFKPNERCCYKFSPIRSLVKTNWSMYLGWQVCNYEEHMLMKEGVYYG